MIKITKTGVQPYTIAGTTVPQTEQYIITDDAGTQTNAKIIYEKKTDKLYVKFNDEQGQNRTITKTSIDNEIAINGYFEIKPKGERTVTTQPKAQKPQTMTITEVDIETYLNEDEIKIYQDLLDKQNEIVAQLSEYNEKIRKAKEHDMLKAILKQAIGKYDIDTVKSIIESL